jgi:hypothetical protein
MLPFDSRCALQAPSGEAAATSWHGTAIEWGSARQRTAAAGCRAALAFATRCAQARLPSAGDVASHQPRRTRPPPSRRPPSPRHDVTRSGRACLLACARTHMLVHCGAAFASAARRAMRPGDGPCARECRRRGWRSRGHRPRHRAVVSEQPDAIERYRTAP